MTLKLVLTENPNQNDLKILQQGIDNYNDQILKQHPHECAVLVRDDNNDIHGGIYFLIYSDSIHIIMIWVDNSIQQKGYGSKLLRAAEEEAIKLNCHSAYVDTFAFQAKDFYTKNGYRCIGEIPDLLIGHSRFFFRKDLINKKNIGPSSNEIYKITLVDPIIAEQICREITADLPEWFGIPEANDRYAKGMNEKTSIGAMFDNQYIGLLSLEFPYPNNANIYWMGIKKSFHRKKVGSTLIKFAENYCRERGCNSITVETLSKKQSDENYLKTYKFYESMGFKPLFDLNTHGSDFAMVYLQKLCCLKGASFENTN